MRAVYYEGRMLEHRPWHVFSGHAVNIRPYHSQIQPSFRRPSDILSQANHHTQMNTGYNSGGWLVLLSACNIPTARGLESRQRIEALPVRNYYIRRGPRMQYHGPVNTNHRRANTPWKYL